MCSVFEKRTILGITITIFEVQKLDGSNFTLWKLKIQALLVKVLKDGCALVLKGTSKPAAMTQVVWDEKDSIARAAIQLSLADLVLFNVVEENLHKTCGLSLKSFTR